MGERRIPPVERAAGDDGRFAEEAASVEPEWMPVILGTRQ